MILITRKLNDLALYFFEKNSFIINSKVKKDLRKLMQNHRSILLKTQDKHTDKTDTFCKEFR